MSEEFDVDADIEEFMGSMANENDELNVLAASNNNHINKGAGEEEDGGAVEYDEDDDLSLSLSANELDIIKQYEKQQYSEEEEEKIKRDKEQEGKDTNGRLYQDDLCKPIAQVGNTKLGLSKAKLFGLKINENGKVDLSKNKDGGGGSHGPDKKHMQNLSKPREAAPVEEEKLDFKPTRNKEALAAMKNKGCGYDFVERLENGSDFMTRLEQGGGGNKAAAAIPKAKLESMEADYEVSQDKLQCPGCKKYQSFDELIEKKRKCGQCNLRYQKLNITSGQGFANRAKDAEEKKLARMKKIEQEMYGGTSSANKSTVGKVMSVREKEAAAAAAKIKGGSKPSRPQSKGTSSVFRRHDIDNNSNNSQPVAGASDAKPSLRRGPNENLGAKGGGGRRSLVVEHDDGGHDALQMMAENHIDNYTSEKELLESLQRQITDGGRGGVGGAHEAASSKKGRAGNERAENSSSVAPSSSSSDARMAKKLQKGLL